MICTFFGHRMAPREIEKPLERVITDLIITHKADFFYVGNQGNFDSIVQRVLRRVKQQYPHIQYAVVLERMPSDNSALEETVETIFPEGMENVPPRYAIDRRNTWMLSKATFVVTYVTHTVGGAFKFKEKARKQRKTVIDIAEYLPGCEQ